MSLFPIMWDFVMEERHYSRAQHGDREAANAGSLAPQPPQLPVGDQRVGVSAERARELISAVDRVNNVVNEIQRGYPDVFRGEGGAV